MNFCIYERIRPSSRTYSFFALSEKIYKKNLNLFFSVTGYVNVEFYNVYKVNEMGGI